MNRTETSGSGRNESGEGNMNVFLKGDEKELTVIENSNLAWGKSNNNEGIFQRIGKDWFLIRGSHYMNNRQYFAVGRDKVTDNGIAISPSFHEAKVYENNELVYIGEVNGSAYHGHGVIYKNGHPSFEGTFRNGSKEGEFHVIDDNGVFVTRIYRNNEDTKEMTEDDKKEKASFKDIGRKYNEYPFVVKRRRDERYLTDLKVFSGFVDGSGKKVYGREYSDNDGNELLFEGEYENNLFKRGSLICHHDVSFKGEFRNGIMQKGELFISNIKVYEGDVNEYGQMHGNGKLYYLSRMSNAECVQYDGEFADGKPNGFGKVYYSNEGRESQLKYCGFFKNGLYDGRGFFFGKNDSYYCGCVLNTYPNVKEFQQRCRNFEKVDFELLDYNKRAGVSQWKEGELDGQIVLFKDSPVIIEFSDRKPMFVYGMPYKNMTITGGVTSSNGDTNAIKYLNISVLLNGLITFKRNNRTYHLPYENGLFRNEGEICINEDKIYSGSISLKSTGSTIDFTPSGEGTLYKNGKPFGEGTCDNGKVLSCTVKVESKTYELTSLTWKWDDASTWKLTGKGRILVNSNLLYDGGVIDGEYDGEGKLYSGDVKYQVVEKVTAGCYIQVGTFKKGKLMDKHSILDRSNSIDGFTARKTEFIDNWIVYSFVNETTKNILWDRVVSRPSLFGLGLYYDNNILMYGFKNDQGKKEGQCDFYDVLPSQLDNIFTSSAPLEKRIKNLKTVKIASYHDDTVNGNVLYYVDDETIICDLTGNGSITKGNKPFYQGALKIIEDSSKVHYWRHGQGSGYVQISSEYATFDGEWNNNYISNGTLSLVDGRKITGKWELGKVKKDEIYTIEEKDSWMKAKLSNLYKPFVIQELRSQGYTYIFEVRGCDTYCKISDVNGIIYEGEVLSVEDCNNLLQSKEHTYTRDKDIKERQKYLRNSKFCKLKYIPNKKGKEYKNNVCIYDGAYEYGVRNGAGKEYRDERLVYDGSWKNDKYNGFGKYQYRYSLSIEGQFSDGKPSGEMEVSKENDIVFSGIVNVKNDRIEPYRGKWYYFVREKRCIEGTLQKIIKRTDVEIKEKTLYFYCPLELDSTSFIMSCRGKGKLMINGYTYIGDFNGWDCASNCIVFIGKNPIFFGSIGSLESLCGIRIHKKYICEGYFKDKNLEFGYFFLSDGRFNTSVGDVNVYEAMYKENKWYYRELYTSYNFPKLQYPTLPAGVGIQPVAVLRTAENQVSDHYPQSIANGSAVITKEKDGTFSVSLVNM